MEEDIKILESECYYLEELGYLRENNHFIRFNQALENLIKDYRDGEDIIKKTVKENLEYKQYIRELEEENKRLKGKIDVCDWQEKSCREIIDEKYIPVSLVKEKIEEVNKSLGYSPVNKILIEQVLQELTYGG